MHYFIIKYPDVENGPGLRVSLFISGCTHNCIDCIKPEYCKFTYGRDFNMAAIREVCSLVSKHSVQGLSILGGEPMELINQKDLAPFIKYVKRRYPNKSIWVYTGYDYEDLVDPNNDHCRGKYTDEILDMIDVLVDKRITLDKNSNCYTYKGAINQRCIDMKATRQSGTVVLYNEYIR